MLVDQDLMVAIVGSVVKEGFFVLDSPSNSAHPVVTVKFWPLSSRASTTSVILGCFCTIAKGLYSFARWESWPMCENNIFLNLALPNICLCSTSSIWLLSGLESVLETFIAYGAKSPRGLGMNAITGCQVRRVKFKFVIHGRVRRKKGKLM